MAASQNYLTLVISMSINGLAVGGCDAFTCLYMGECSHPKYRGQFMTSMFILVISSTVIMYALALVLNWRGLAVFIAVAPLLRLPVLLKIPESPTWLLSQGRTEEARKAMQWLYGDHYDIQDEFEECLKHQEDTKRAMSTWRDVLRWQYVKPVAIVAILTVLRQFSGGTALLMYLLQVLRRSELGFESRYAAVAISCAQLMFILVSGRLFDVIGRKKTVLLSGTLMFVSEMAMGAYFYMEEDHDYKLLLKG
jgi:MFS family permease